MANRFFEGLGLAFCSVAAVVMAAEVVVRTFMAPPLQYDATAKVDADPASLCRDASDAYEAADDCYARHDSIAKVDFSTYFGYVPAPGEAGRGYRTNRATMRYDHELTGKAAGEKRVFVTGGSTAWGAGVSQASLYATVAEGALRGRFPGARVVSAGVGGYLASHELLRYSLYVRPHKPDVWVMFTGWNDVYAAYRGTDYLLSPDMLDLTSIVLAARPESVVLRDRMVGGVGTPAGAPAPRQPLWGAYRFKLMWLVDLAMFRASLAANADRGATAGADRLQIPGRGRLSPAEAVDQFMSQVAMAAHIARRDGVKLVVVLQPSVYSSRKTLTPWEQRMFGTAEKLYPALATYFQTTYPMVRARLREFAGRENITYFDADEAIVREPKSIFADHVHLGDRGNRLIGLAMAEVLVPLLSAGEIAAAR